MTLSLTLGLLFVAGCVAAAVQALTGSGFGLVAAPLVVLLAPDLLPGPLLVVTLGIMAAALVAGWRTGGRPGREDVALLWPAGLGIVVGVLVTAPALGWITAHQPLVTTLVGVGVIVSVAPTLLPARWRPAFGGGRTPRARQKIMGGAGAAAGVLTVTAALPGPPLILAYSARDAARYRTGLAVLFLVASVASLAVLVPTTGVAPGGWEGTGVFSAGVAVGYILGFLAGRRIPLRVVVLGSRVTVLAAAVVLLVPGVGA